MRKKRAKEILKIYFYLFKYFIYSANRKATTSFFFIHTKLKLKSNDQNKKK